MNETYGVLGTPGVGFFSLLIIGGIAGWLAEKITKSDHGILTNIIVGIAGSFIGSTLATTAGIAVNGSLGRLIAAVIGAVILVYGWRMIKGRQNPQQQQQGYGNQPMPPNDGQYGNQQGQYGEPQGEWINEPPPGQRDYGNQGGQGGQRGQGYDNNRPPRDNNSPLDRR